MRRKQGEEGFVMEASQPILLVPGLNCSARLYEAQIPALWQFGPVQVADHRRGDSMAAIARAILEHAPPRFALVGLSMGGYISFELLRQAKERVVKLALLDTAAGPERPEQTERRRKFIAMTREGKANEREDIMWPTLVHETRLNDAALRLAVKQMHQENGAEAYIRQQTAIMGRPDSRPLLPSLDMKTLIVVGDSDQLTPPAASREMAGGIPGAKLEVLPGCGHMSTMERPDRVTKLLVEWLSG
jgi:pimeloyl-ACP methyl ester carboxylesterase